MCRDARRHKEIVRSINLNLCNKYYIKKGKKLRILSITEIVGNENVEMKVDIIIKTVIVLKNNMPAIFEYGKKLKEITLIEMTLQI